ncbi:MAG: hypothetical protein IJM92_16775 [Fibrobacter sp.]|uniref:hypothetical protein n=1 Tax=Fibrobacter sp. TaxID=35828 RepID=UPI0025C20390|nr:hypothetical protein [Fibrobacter sp.]MBQ3714074.1 hypothetical protein [Fibrobacter sp.]MBQ7081276.1 hypothetical protein [Fibrobacter sp.]
MNIFEILEKRKINPTDEFHRLSELFNKEFWSYSKGDYSSVKKILDENFQNCPCRSSFLSIDDLLKSLQIDENSRYLISWETLFTYCEILRNVVDEKIGDILQDDDFEKLQQMMLDNMDIILAKTNHGWAKIKEGYVIVDKNPATTEAIECLEEKDSELALKMVEYNRVLLKGNLDRKREILASMASYVEPLKALFNGTIYSSLYNDSRNMVNKLNIRHNNSGIDTLPEYAKNWSEKEFEVWYDNAYHTLLMVILAQKQLEITQNFNKLKSEK